MNKPINPDIVVAHSQCLRKAYLLLCTKTKGTPHEYRLILEEEKNANRERYLQKIASKASVQPYNGSLKGGSDFVSNAILKTEDWEATCDLLTKVDSRSALGRYSYEPTIVVGTHSISKAQRLRLFFVGYVLGKAQNRFPETGRIIDAAGKSYKIKLGNSEKTILPVLESLREWKEASDKEPPPVILNKHCPSCQFQSLCRSEAEREDNLSLLDRISTARAIQKYEKKGLFTVKQLSYTFKPRRRRKRTKNPPAVIHKPELQALAIHQEKIYLQELTDLTRKSVELFLDIEGIPDRRFYYLIGLLVYQDTTSFYPFWADTAEDEPQMWQQFLEKVNQFPDAPIYHYGSFEPRTIRILAKRYNTDCDILIKRLININKHVYGRVYFPTYSNRLKEIGGYIGATWTGPNASGLQSLVWRHHWEETEDIQYKEKLLTYNAEDCYALKFLVDELSRIRISVNKLSEVDFADKRKQQASQDNKLVHSQFESILKFAHMDYDKKKISFRQNESKKKKGEKKKMRVSKKGYQGQRKNRPKPTRVVHVTSEKTCPKCKNELLRPTEKLVTRLIIDLIKTRNGIRKSITKYVGTKGYCRSCGKLYNPSRIAKYVPTRLYGHGFKAWLVYHRVAMRLPYESISEMAAEHFNERIHAGSIVAFIKDFARYYAETERWIIQCILESPVIHVDETRVNIKGINWYGWVFTDGEHVAFKLTETRETTIVHELLSDYTGVLVTDFYGGYDSVQCRQQKCWVHLIRDLNDDLRENPYDKEYETFILEVRDLFVPIMEAVQKYGLKKRNLNKFRKQVDRFYQKVIIDKRYKSDLVSKYQKRFIRYRDSLFTFLEQDGISWHNNTAERGIRHLAIQRAISSPLHESSTRSYLVLLGIQQTCRFQGKSLFRFLFSGETDLDKFEVRKRSRGGRK